MAFFTRGGRGIRPGVYVTIKNKDQSQAAYSSNAVTPSPPGGGSGTVTVELFVKDGLLYANGPAFSMAEDEVVVCSKVLRPAVQGETLAVMNSI